MPCMGKGRKSGESTEEDQSVRGLQGLSTAVRTDSDTAESVWDRQKRKREENGINSH